MGTARFLSNALHRFCESVTLHASLALILQALASTAVSHSLLLERNADDISEAPELSLVIAKGNRLEVHDVGPAGLTERCELDVWGQIVGLAKAPWNVRSFICKRTTPS